MGNMENVKSKLIEISNELIANGFEVSAQKENYEKMNEYEYANNFKYLSRPDMTKKEFLIEISLSADISMRKIRKVIEI